MTIDWVQLFGALFGAVGALLVASQEAPARCRGFQCFAASNGFLIAWALGHAAWWLLALQLFFMYTSARGIWANRKQA